MTSVAEIFGDVLAGSDAPPAHARLSPSSAHRWMNCAGSIEATDNLPSRTTIYAAEGTAAHALAERCGKGGTDAADYLGDVIQVEGWEFTVDEEMVAGVQMYLDTVRGDDGDGGELQWERRLPLPFLPGDQFGTSDATRYFPATKRLRVYDLKYGQGVAVSPIENPQQILYAGGSVVALPLPVTDIELVIIQPRAFHPHGPVRRWSLTTAELMERLGEISEKAEAAVTPGAERCAGEWCRFCGAAGDCVTLAAASLAEAQLIFGDEAPDPKALTNEQIGRHLTKAGMLRAWISALESRVLEALCGGEEVPGWKLVDKRAIRRWAAPEQDVIARLGSHGLPLDAVAPRELVSPAKTDKLLGKDARKDLASIVTKISTGLTIAPESDARPAVQAGTYSGGDYASVLGSTADD